MTDQPALGDRPESCEVAAYSSFYREAVPPLIAFLRHLGAPFEVAADCVQETMIKALPPVWSTLTHPRAWCRRTSYHFYVQHLRQRREHPDADIELGPNPLINPDTNLEEVEARHEINWLLEKLPDRQREVMAFVFDDASTAEIADTLSITTGTVRATVRDARKKLVALQAESRRGGGTP